MIRTICICEKCSYAWFADKIPPRCAFCKNRSWNSTKLGELLGQNGTSSTKSAGNGTNSANEPAFDIPDDVKPVAELADTGEPYKRSEGALADKLKAALADPKPAKSPYCRHGLAYHPGCNA